MTLKQVASNFFSSSNSLGVVVERRDFSLFWRILKDWTIYVKSVEADHPQVPEEAVWECAQATTLNIEPMTCTLNAILLSMNYLNMILVPYLFLRWYCPACSSATSASMFICPYGHFPQHGIGASSSRRVLLLLPRRLRNSELWSSHVLLGHLQLQSGETSQDEIG